eukprot:EG_transcript_16405
MNQQTVLESKRILAILDDLLDDVSLLHTASTSSNRLSEDLQIRLGELMEAEDRLEAAPSLSNEELLFQHRTQVRGLLDFLRYEGVAPNDGVEDGGEEGLLRFLVVLRTLRGLMSDKFHTTVEEDLLKFEILRDTVSREQTASADVKALNREFQSERNLRRVEVAKRDQLIAKLQEELQYIQETAGEEAKEFDRRVRFQDEEVARTYQQEEQGLQAQVQQLEASLKKARDANQKEEAALRQERRKREQFLDGLLTQYDTEMTSKTGELQQYSEDYSRDQARLEELEKELKVFDEKQAMRDSEERRENSRRAHQMEILNRIEMSSKLLQAFWRGYSLRMMLKKKKTGKKKKK